MSKRRRQRSRRARGGGGSPSLAEMSPRSRRALMAAGILGGILLLGVASALMAVLTPVFALAWTDRDYVFFLGAGAVFALAVLAVRAAGPNLTRGLLFHLTGVLGPYFLGTTYPDAFGRLQVMGGVVYLTSWCWVFLGDTVVRLYRMRQEAQQPRVEG